MASLASCLSMKKGLSAWGPDTEMSRISVLLTVSVLWAWIPQAPPVMRSAANGYAKEKRKAWDPENIP